MEVIAAFVNAIAMVAVVVWIFIEAFDRISSPVPVKGLGVFAIAFVGLAVNILVAWSLSRDRDNVNTRAAFIHVMGDLLGSVAAIAAGAIIYFGGPLMVDPLLSMLVGGLILRSTFGVLRETTFVLLDSVPEGVDYARVGTTLAADSGRAVGARPARVVDGAGQIGAVGPRPGGRHRALAGDPAPGAPRAPSRLQGRSHHAAAGVAAP